MDLSMHAKTVFLMLGLQRLPGPQLPIKRAALEWTQRRTQGRSSSHIIKPVNLPFGSNLNYFTALCYTEIMLLIMLMKAKRSLLYGRSCASSS